MKKWRIRSLLVAVLLCACALRLWVGMVRDKYRKEAEFYARVEQDSLRIAEHMDKACAELRETLLQVRKMREARAKTGVHLADPHSRSVHAMAELEQDIAEREATAKSSRQEAEVARQWREHYQRLSGQTP